MLESTDRLHARQPDRLEPDWCRAIHTSATDGGDDGAVTTGPGPADRCEQAPDGGCILSDTERFSTTPGRAQLARVRPDGSARGGGAPSSARASGGRSPGAP